MAAFTKNFECPPDFKEEIVLSQLCLEDIDDDSELWLVRMPSDIELSDLDKKKISLSEKSISNIVTTESGKVLECFLDNHELPNLCAVLPRKEDKKLREVKQVFTGSILLTECLYPNELTQVKSEISDEADNNIATESVKISSSPKKKKKKSKFKDEQYYSEREDNGTADTSNTKKRSKSRISLEGTFTDIKNEPLTSDRDDFPYV